MDLLPVTLSRNRRQCHMDAEISQQTPILRSYYQIRDKKRMHIEFAKESSNSEKKPEGTDLSALITKL